MREQKTVETSGAKVSDPAQRSLGETDERPPRGGFHRRWWKRRGAPRPLLDSMVVSARTDGCGVHSQASRKRRRAYHRLRTGLAFHHGERLRFLTLTLVKGSQNDIHQCFRAFKERIRRLTPNKLRKLDTENYFTPARMQRFFGDEKNWDKPIRFEYFSVIITGERPHMHILYFGDWLPHAWLKKVWQEITGDSDIVDIRTTREGINNDKRLTGYVLAQYAQMQEGRIRFQMSRGWAWRGMVRDWKNAVRNFTRNDRGTSRISFKSLLEYWGEVIRGTVGRETKQMALVAVKSETKKRKKYPIH